MNELLLQVLGADVDDACAEIELLYSFVQEEIKKE